LLSKAFKLNKKKVSIIIPTFNEAKYLPLCLKALLSIDYPKEYFEIIVVDNGSTDCSREIAKEYHAKVYRNDLKNVSGLRNLEVKKSVGEIIAFLDADCVVTKNWLIEAEKYFFDLSVALWGAAPGPPKKTNLGAKGMVFGTSERETGARC